MRLHLKKVWEIYEAGGRYPLWILHDQGVMHPLAVLTDHEMEELVAEYKAEAEVEE